MFQFLIGRLGTLHPTIEVLERVKFQFLIGRLGTKNGDLVMRISSKGFNSL